MGIAIFVTSGITMALAGGVITYAMCCTRPNPDQPPTQDDREADEATAGDENETIAQEDEKTEERKDNMDASTAISLRTFKLSARDDDYVYRRLQMEGEVFA